jgi:two-component system NtrC family sensor kinase
MRQGGRSGQRVKGPHANRPKARKVSTATPSIADLQKQLNARSRELKEAREHQTAIAEVLQIINSSQGDLAPVFDGILQRAIRLCDAAFGNLWLYDGEKFDLVAAQGPFPSSYLEMLSQAGQHAGPHTAMRRAVLTQQTIQIPDYQLEQAYLDRDPVAVATAEVGNARTILAVPMVGEARALGVFFVYRQEVRSFSKRQIALLQSFAAQAVIAMENARLLTETREALEQQTATADVLKVISRSAFDLQTVLDTLVVSAARLCDADRACIFQKKGEVYRWVSNFGFSTELIAYADEHPFTAGTHSTTSRVALEGKPIHNPDVLADPNYRASEYQRLGDYRSMLGIPLLREGAPIGVFILTRQQVRPFTDRQIELVTGFADQAVIAIENVRLFDEVQVRTRELAASLDDLRAAQDRLVQTETGIAHEIKNPLNFVNNFSALSAELIEEMKDMLSDCL